MSRRGNGDGALRQRKDGLWELAVSVGSSVDGKAKRKSFYGKTKKEVKEKHRAWLELGGANTPIERVNNVKEWATHWLEIYKSGKVSIDTFEQYEGLVKKYIIPTIGHVKLKDVKPAHIQMLMNKYEEMSSSHLSKLRMVTNAIFESAIDNDYCSRNPCRNIRPASVVSQKESECFSDAELSAIIKFSNETDSMASLGIYIMLHTGLRPEELLGLMWSDIDYNESIIHVRRTVVDIKGRKTIKESMKNTSSRRDVPLVPQLAERLAAKKKGDLFILHGKDGGYYSPSGFRGIYRTFFKALNLTLGDGGVSMLSPHKCRHTFATRLMKTGVNLKLVQSILGHSDISTTGNVYLHADIASLKQAMGEFRY